MAKSNLEKKVGLFVALGLLLLAGLLLQFSKGTTFFRSTYELKLKTANVAGIKARSSVLMSGVPVGTVSRIELSPNGKHVTIYLKIYKDFKVHRDARFVIEQSGFLGDQYVGIIVGDNSGELLNDGDEVESPEPFNIQEVARSAAGFIQRIDETAKKLDDAISRIDRLVLNEQTLTNLSATAGNFRLVSERALNTVDGINTMIETNRAAIDASVSNVYRFSGQLNAVGDDLQVVVKTNSAQISIAVNNIESSTVILKNLLDDLQAGHGLAGGLLKDEQLKNHVSLLASNLAVTSSNLNRLGLWGILWKSKPPRTESQTNQVLYPPKNPFN
ncbi:MAG: MCE family protein [Verrucomicrobia bacterium]|nr:MCE family protein [Verrucomicrobiota bacterium]